MGGQFWNYCTYYCRNLRAKKLELKKKNFAHTFFMIFFIIDSSYNIDRDRIHQVASYPSFAPGSAHLVGSLAASCCDETIHFFFFVKKLYVFFQHLYIGE